MGLTAGSAGATAQEEAFPYDATVAEQLLAEAGWLQFDRQSDGSYVFGLDLDSLDLDQMRNLMGGEPIDPADTSNEILAAGIEFVDLGGQPLTADGLMTPNLEFVDDLAPGVPSFFEFQQAVQFAWFVSAHALTRDDVLVMEASFGYSLPGNAVLDENPMFSYDPLVGLSSNLSIAQIGTQEFVTHAVVSDGQFGPTGNPLPVYRGFVDGGVFWGIFLPGTATDVQVQVAQSVDGTPEQLAASYLRLPAPETIVRLGEDGVPSAANLEASRAAFVADPPAVPVVEEPVVEEPVVEEPVVEEPVVEEPVVEEPVVEEPVGGDAPVEATPVVAESPEGESSGGGGSTRALALGLLVAAIGIAAVVAARKRLFGQSVEPPPIEMVEPIVPFDGGGPDDTAAGLPVEATEPIVPFDGRPPDAPSPVDELLGSPEMLAAAATQDAIDAAGEPTVDWGEGDAPDGWEVGRPSSQVERTETGLPYVPWTGPDVDDGEAVVDPLAGEATDPPPVLPTIWVVDERGPVIGEIVRHDAFGIVAVHPDDGTAPDTVEVLVQVGDEQLPITLPQVGSDEAGYVTYRSNGHVLGSDWDLGGIDVVNGARMSITAEGFRPFTGHAHSEHASRDLALATQHLRVAEDAWRGVLAALPVLDEHANGWIDIDRMRSVATGYLRMIELAGPSIQRHSGHRWRSALDDDRIEWGKAVAVAEAAVRRIPVDPMAAFADGSVPQINATGEARYLDELEGAAEYQHTTTRSAFVNVIGGSVLTGYRVFAATSGGDIWWTLATGTDEMGAERARTEAVQDLLIEAMVGSLVGFGMRGLHGGPDLPFNGTGTKRAVPPLTQTSQPRRPRTGPPSQGAIVDAEMHGLRYDLVASARAVAARLGVVLGLRPGNVYSMLWQRYGHAVKNIEIKSKTLAPRDVFIGGPATSGHAYGPREPFGLVGYFDPQLPSRPPGISDADWDILVVGGRRTPGMSDEVWDGVKQEFTADVHRILGGGKFSPAGASADLASGLPGRFAQRRLEFEDNAAWYGQLIDEGKIEIRNGVVWNTGLYEGKHAGITGDIDVFEIFGLNGKALPYDQYVEVVDYLKAHPDLLIVHGAHMRWPVDFPFTSSKDKGIFATIVQQHAGKEPIILVGGYGDGLVRATYTRNGDLITATDGRVLWSPDGGWIAPHSYGAPTHIGVGVSTGTAIPSAAGVDGESGMNDPGHRHPGALGSVDATVRSATLVRRPGLEGDDLAVPHHNDAASDDAAPPGRPVWSTPNGTEYRDTVVAAAGQRAIDGGTRVSSEGWTWVTSGQWYEAHPTPVSRPNRPNDPDAFGRFVNIHSLQTVRMDPVEETREPEPEQVQLWRELVAEFPESQRQDDPTPLADVEHVEPSERGEATLASTIDEVIDL
jgi:hypothetical protein